MTYTVSITSQGQLNLPIKIRRDYGFLDTSKALVSVENGKIIVEPVKDLIRLRGSMKTSIKANAKQIRSAFENYLASEVLEK